MAHCNQFLIILVKALTISCDFLSHSQFHGIDCLYLDMHGLIFETSI
jgi:hypothetical protein